MGVFNRFKIVKPYTTYAENSDAQRRNAENGGGNVDSGNTPLRVINDPANAGWMQNVQKAVANPTPAPTPIPKPAPDYDTMEDDEVLASLAPMSEKEQKERADRANAINGIGHFTRALGALGNVIGVSGGMPHVAIGEYQGPSTDAFNDKVWGQRAKYLSMKQSVDKERENREYRTNKMKDMERRTDGYLANLAKRNEKIDADIEVSELTAMLRQAQYDLAEARAQGYPQELQAKLENYASQIQARLQNANTAAYRAQTAASQGQQRIEQGQQRIAMQDAVNKAKDRDYQSPASVSNQQVASGRGGQASQNASQNTQRKQQQSASGSQNNKSKGDPFKKRK